MGWNRQPTHAPCSRGGDAVIIRRRGVESVEQLCEVRASQSAAVFAPPALCKSRSGRNKSGSPLPLHMEFMICMLIHFGISVLVLAIEQNLVQQGATNSTFSDLAEWRCHPPVRNAYLRPQNKPQDGKCL